MEKIINDLEIEFNQAFISIMKKIEEYDYTLPTIDKVFLYGTSGFRYHESELDRISFRAALVTSLKSQCFGGQPMGIMVTASHNKYEDNGIKIAGPKGEGISLYWEEIYSKIINSKNLTDDIKTIIRTLIKDEVATTKYFFRDLTPIVNVAYDTRNSSERLVKIIKECLQTTNSKYKVYGVLSTPALQFLTLLNQFIFKKSSSNVHNFYFADADEYWKFLSGAYFAFNTFYEQFYSPKSLVDKYETELVIDCANGVAAYHYQNIAKILNDRLKLTFINTDYKNYKYLNEGCGAEHVHKEKLIPSNYPENVSTIKNLSFDGDVDRIIYFINSGDSSIKMVDGDHLICLFALCLRFLISKLSKSLQQKFQSDIKIGIVCTAYSNGAFMNYITSNLKFTLIMAKTGVKHLHHKAKNFDLAIYFESNGHGTVYTDESIISKIEKLNCFIESSSDSQTLELLSIFLSMFNRTTGDSLSALIAIESSLKLLNMPIFDLYNIYEELESVNVKVTVKDKSQFIPNEDESKLIHPEDIQSVIDRVVEKYNSGRCFVRPSGTEDIVRIYAEAKSNEEAKEIAETVRKAIADSYA